MADKLDELRRAIAEISGYDPETWPSHGNAGLAIAACYQLRILEARAERAARIAAEARLAAAEKDAAKGVDVVLRASRAEARLADTEARLAAVTTVDERLNSLIQALHSGFSRRAWQDTERAGNEVRDHLQRKGLIR